MLKLVVLVALVGLVAAANGPSAAWTKNAGIACTNRNELPTQHGITIETAKAYCKSESTCVSFEANPTTGRFQFSTSCTVSVADRTDMDGWSLFVIARKTPTASQRANLKLAHDNYATNTKASIAAAEPLYKQAVVDFNATLGAKSFLTKSAKVRYNYLLVHDSSKPAAEQALVGKTPYAASELLSRLNGTSHDQCSDGVQNGDETGVDCGGSCSVCPCTATALSKCATFPCVDLREDTMHHHVMYLNSDGTAHIIGGANSWNDARTWTGTCSGTCVGLVGTWSIPGFYADTITISADYSDDFTGVRSNDHMDVCGLQEPVDCVSSETTCTCTPACANTCKCTDTITITTPAAGRGQACPSATVRTFTGTACPTP
jgi:hypothetical protein